MKMGPVLDKALELIRDRDLAIRRESFIKGFVEARSPTTPADTLKTCNEAEMAFADMMARMKGEG